MTKIITGIILALLMAVPAAAMNQSAVPPKFPIPWGNSAGISFLRSIPQSSQIGIQNCAASLTDGFPPLTFTPVTSGGCPPFGQDMNGILKQLSLWSQWVSAGAPVIYDGAFSTSIGGYPKGAILTQAATPSCIWISTVDNNASNPDTSGANWNGVCFPFGPAAGTPGTVAYLNLGDQTLTGGANVTSLALASSSQTIDCGLRPLQYIVVTGTISLAAPINDGTCMIQLENSGATGLSFTGFTLNGNTGEPYTLANGAKFVMTVWRIHGTSSLMLKALQ